MYIVILTIGFFLSTTNNALFSWMIMILKSSSLVPFHVSAINIPGTFYHARLRPEWCSNLGIAHAAAAADKSMGVCSKHFLPGSFTIDKCMRSRLRKDAFPVRIYKMLNKMWHHNDQLFFLRAIVNNKKKNLILKAHAFIFCSAELAGTAYARARLCQSFRTVRKRWGMVFKRNIENS